MRTTTLALAATMILAIASLSAEAQRGSKGNRPDCDREPRFERRMEQRIPNLTPEQETKLQVLRTKHLKEVTPLRNELREKKARLNTLQSAEKPDMAAINKTIDEIAALKSGLMKKHAAHRAEVSQVLSDEQRVHFNARMGKGRGKGMR